jgi:hypothetical protein
LAADRYEAAQAAVRISHYSREPAYPFADEVATSESVDLWPADYEWFPLAAIVKDAVTAYEVYVRNASAEVLAFLGLLWRELKRATGWDQLSRFCRTLGLDARPPVLSEVFALHHVLTHSGGELRTADDISLFAGPAASLAIGDRVVLSSTTNLIRSCGSVPGVVTVCPMRRSPHLRRRRA